MQDNKNFLAAEPIGKLLLKLSIPTVIAQLINMLYNIVDRIYIGHIPSDGSLALTGVGVCMPIIMIVTAFAALVSSGGAPRASIYMGKQDNESAENILGNCFLLQIVISLILTAILLIWSKDLLLAFGASENTISYATDYMHIYAFGTLFVQLTLGMNAFIMQASESIVTVCFNSSLLRYGGDIAVGAMTILTSVMQFAMLPLQGIAQGAQPISSYNYGAKNTNRVKKTFRLLLMTCLSYSALLWAAVQLIPRVFVSIFTADASLINFTAPMLRIYLGGLFLFGIQIACQMTFTSLGKAVNSIVVAVVRKFVLLLPLIYIMPHVVSNPTTGVYMAEPIADIIAVLFTSVLFSFQFKKALAEIQNENN